MANLNEYYIVVISRVVVYIAFTPCMLIVLTRTKRNHTICRVIYTEDVTFQHSKYIEHR